MNESGRQLGKLEIEAFLTHLAVDRRVSASTRHQAFNALLFLYRELLELAMPQLDHVLGKTNRKKTTANELREIFFCLFRISMVPDEYSEFPRAHRSLESKPSGVGVFN